jgi:hypothetical protein
MPNVVEDELWSGRPAAVTVVGPFDRGRRQRPRAVDLADRRGIGERAPSRSDAVGGQDLRRVQPGRVQTWSRG